MQPEGRATRWYVANDEDQKNGEESTERLYYVHGDIPLATSRDRGDKKFSRVIPAFARGGAKMWEAKDARRRWFRAGLIDLLPRHGWDTVSRG